MPDERTRRFDRLLAMRQQLERLAQWRLAAARRLRLDAEGELSGLEQTLSDARTARGEQLTTMCDPAFVRAAIAAENQSLVRLAEQRAAVQSRLKDEASYHEEFLAAERQTRQSEKLCEQAHEVVNDQEQRALQLEWDEYGTRAGGRPDPLTAVARDADAELESRP